MGAEGGPLVSRVPLSPWLRVLLGAFGLIGIGLVASGLATFPVITVTDVFELVGGAVSAALGISAVRAACVLSVDEGGVRLGFWMLYRTRIPLDRIEEFRADRWNSWDFGGYGIKGDGPRGRRGLLLNATADATGHGDTGILIRTADGRTYRIEVHDPERFAAAANRMIAGYTAAQS